MYEAQIVQEVQRNQCHYGRRTLHPLLCSCSDAYSTLDPRGRLNTLDDSLKPADKDAAQVDLPLLYLCFPSTEK